VVTTFIFGLLIGFLLVRVGRLSKNLRDMEKKRREDWKHFSCLLVGIERDIIDMQDWIKRRIHNDAERN
jgi:hypothetical protein